MTQTRIYFAGVNQALLCHAFAGFRVLESFADVCNVVEKHRPNFKSMCLDSGAFSVMTTGKEIDLGEYIAFCQERGRFYDFVASLDSITGGVDVNAENWQKMKDAGVDSIPTYHQGEPWSVLEGYCRDAKMIGLGFQRPIIEPRRYLDEAFSRIPRGTRVHGWGMTNFTDYPFWSVDSTTWLHEYLDLKSYKGQGAQAIRCLTEMELLEIVQKKYLRFGKRTLWNPEMEKLK